MNLNRTRYTLLLHLVAPLLLVTLVWRCYRHVAVRARWRELLGLYQHSTSRTPLRPVMFHAVSVGEVHAAVPLIEAFLAAHPDIPVLVTCCSVTGSARIAALFGTRVQHVFLPWDLPGAVNRFLRHFRPRMIVLLETELWPNLINLAHRCGTHVMVVNARLSKRSQQRYAGIGTLAPEMLADIDLIAAQSAADAERFRMLGNPAAVVVTGNLKYDLALSVDAETARALRHSMFGDRPVLIAASTREGEDAKLLAAFRLMRERCPRLALVLVPRHPERFQSATCMFEAAGFSVVRRSSLANHHEGGMDVLIGDTMGELLYYYSLADLAFVGGSLVDAGCHNIIEPAALGLPVITGPSRHNFRQVSDDLISAGALCIVEDEAALAACVCRLLENAEARMVMARAASQTVELGKGATLRTLALVVQTLERTPARNSPDEDEP